MGTLYQNKGYEDRKDYLECLAEDYGVDKKTVFTLASMLGSNEDFDGLVNALEDIEEGLY